MSRAARLRHSGIRPEVSRRAQAALTALALATACGGKGGQRYDRTALLAATTCKQCHEDHYREWSASMHAYATDDPVFLAMNRRGQEETDGELGPFCAKCHAPMAVAEGAISDFAELEDIPQELTGVTCYFCHNAKSVEGTHNNPVVLANDTTMRGNVADPLKNPVHRGEYSRLLDGNAIESATVCGSCHDIVVDKTLSGATEDVHLERTFAEWKDGFFANIQSCARCHMAPIQDVPIANFDGVSVRTRHHHGLPAVDVALDPFPQGAPDAEAEQRSAVEYEIDQKIALARICVQDNTVRVELENLAAGHSVPSGATQDRRLWAELKVYDYSDAEIFRSGVLDDELTPIARLLDSDPQLWLLRTEALDAQGNEAHMFWDIATVVTEDPDSGLPLVMPGKKTTEQLLPDQTPNPDYHREVVSHTYTAPGIVGRVELKLRLRPMGLEVLQDLVDSGHLESKYLEAMPIHDVLPARGQQEITLGWSPDDGECSATGAK